MFQGLRTAIYPVHDLEEGKRWYSEALETEPYFDEPFYVGFNVAGYELGRKGGISGLSSQEMEWLNRVHASHDQISEPLLEQAFGQAELMTIPVIVFHLQKLLHERNP